MKDTEKYLGVADALSRLDIDSLMIQEEEEEEEEEDEAEGLRLFSGSEKQLHQ
jgi:hypothetical protein